MAEERYARPDTSVAGQVLKLVAANPDAILIGASGTGAALPQSAQSRDSSHRAPAQCGHCRVGNRTG